MDDPCARRVRKVLVRAVALEVIVYSLVGVCGFLALGPPCVDSVPGASWPSCTPTNMIASPRVTGTWGVIARVAMLITLCVCIPMNLAAGRSVLNQRLFPAENDPAAAAADDETQSGHPDVAMSPTDTPLWYHLLVSVGFLVAAAAIAVVYAHISVILGILGGGCAVTFMFTVPLIATLMLYHHRWEFRGERRRGSLGDRALPGTPRIGNFLGVTRRGVYAASSVMLVCVLLGYISAVVSVAAIFEGN